MPNEFEAEDPSRRHTSIRLGNAYRPPLLSGSQERPRPLIDYVDNAWRLKQEYYDYEDDSSDEDLSDYKDLTWDERVAVFKADCASAIRSRTFRRILAACILIPILIWLAWDSYVLPVVEEQQVFYESLKSASKPQYGVNIRPYFKDMIQLRDLDNKLLPVGKEHGGHARRLVVVGDVHGCKEELIQLLAKIRFDHKYDHLIFTGDMIGKGPDSKGVIDFARSIGASSVRGNHEDELLTAYAALQDADLEAHHIDLKNASAEDLARLLPTKDITWLAQNPVILNVGIIPDSPFKKVVVVHAGLAPGVPLNNQDPFHVMNMRAIDPQTNVPSPDRNDGVPWWRVWNRAQKQLSKNERTLVIYGHDSKIGLKRKKYSIGLDTGCVKGGLLSALIIKGGEQEQKDMELISIPCQRFVD